MMRGPDPVPFRQWWQDKHRPRHHPRIADDQYRIPGRAVVEGLLGMIPGVGEAMDAREVGMGLLTGDRSRAAFGAAGLLLPFAGGTTLRRVLGKAGELGESGGGRPAWMQKFLDENPEVAQKISGPKSPDDGVRAHVSDTRSYPAYEVVDDISADPDDLYVYHVTSDPNAKAIVQEGLRAMGGMAGRGGYAAHSSGRVFVTDKGGVPFWRDRIEQHLFDQFDDPPPVSVVRIPRRAFGRLTLDDIGTRDARHRAFWATEADAPDPGWWWDIE